MSLVLAFIGKSGAVMAGDMREISFQGEKTDREKLEKELYSGALITENELEKKAEELKVKIKVTDFKSKVSERDGILVGEVSSFEDGVLKIRRLYASAGNYAIAELKNNEFTLTSHGKGSNFITFGNEYTKQAANKCFQDNWTKTSNFEDAIRIVKLCMETVANKTASVSKKFVLVQTASSKDVLKVVENDKQG